MLESDPSWHRPMGGLIGDSRLLAQEEARGIAQRKAPSLVQSRTGPRYRHTRERMRLGQETCASSLLSCVLFFPDWRR